MVIIPTLQTRQLRPREEEEPSILMVPSWGLIHSWRLLAMGLLGLLPLRPLGWEVQHP